MKSPDYDGCLIVPLRDVTPQHKMVIESFPGEVIMHSFVVVINVLIRPHSALQHMTFMDRYPFPPDFRTYAV